MKKLSFFLITAISIASVVSLAHASSDGGFQYISPAEVKKRIENGAPMTILDIQVREEYDRHHVKGATATFAYPVKSDADRAKLETVMDKLTASDDPIVIVCPRGGGGAKRTWQYLASKGIRSNRMYILESGQGGWPYPELLVSN